MSKSRGSVWPMPLAPILFVGGFSAVVMLLWNNILPDVIHVGRVSYWQAMGILVLSKILFGIGRPGGPGAPWQWRAMQRRMKHMEPGEKKQFREEMMKRLGMWHEMHLNWRRMQRHLRHVPPEVRDKFREDMQSRMSEWYDMQKKEWDKSFWQPGSAGPGNPQPPKPGDMPDMDSKTHEE